MVHDDEINSDFNELVQFLGICELENAEIRFTTRFASTFTVVAERAR
jgi:hypothetical protein